MAMDNEKEQVENSQAEHWSEISEVGGSPWHFRFMLWVVCHMPLVMVECCTAVICFFFWLGAKPVRERSSIYLRHLAKVSNFRIGLFCTYWHIYSFALSMVEKLLGWNGVFRLDRVETGNDDFKTIIEQLNRGEGALLLCSHLGNMEMLRALTGNGESHAKKNFEVYPVVDFSGTSKFNSLLRELNPNLMNHVVDANNVGADTAVWMKEQIAAGNLVVIAGDRTSANFRNRVLQTDFLGEMANFPEGALSLAGILKAPIYFAFAVRKRDFSIMSTYELHIVRARTSLECTRKDRSLRLQQLLQEYTAILETLCVKHPYQWYNFFNFWENNEYGRKEN